ncbi:MAG: argininosuccinate synthase [Herpetosiphonaceae bacterium]|nr:argininosuccinate synthase [Herpetosiphonaceae bacterium]
MTKAVQKIVLAYSGGLDTSIIVPWLREHYDAEIICYCSDLGQEEELGGLETKALASGAAACIIEDLREEFIRDYILPTVQAGAVYERKYLLGTSMARPLIAKRQVEVARRYGADAVAHGCTGKGNDQVRFELTYMALNPQLTVIAPWREWEIRSREDAIRYAHAHHVPIAQTERKIYSRDRNIWHISHEGGVLEDPWNEPEADMFTLTADPETAPAQAETLVLAFEQGVPVAVNGQRLGQVELLLTLNELGSKHGIGRIDLVENRLVGMKSHGVYETPGGTIWVTAHRELESLTLDRETLHYKDRVALDYADLVYNGRWFTPLRQHLDHFVQDTQRNVTGEVRLKLHRGQAIVIGRRSPASLYREDFATFGEEEVYNQRDAEGFIHLYGLPLKVEALLAAEDGAGQAAQLPTHVTRD